MLKTVSGTVGEMMSGQSTIEQIQAAEPTGDFDGKYGDGFIKNTAFVEMLYKDMAPD